MEEELIKNILELKDKWESLVKEYPVSTKSFSKRNLECLINERRQSKEPMPPYCPSLVVIEDFNKRLKQNIKDTYKELKNKREYLERFQNLKLKGYTRNEYLTTTTIKTIQSV